MWNTDLKIVLSFCIYTALAYNHQDYIKWKERLSSVQTTTTQKPVSNDIYYESLKLRHHSRFPNLDRVMHKIDNIQSGKKKHLVKVRHQTIYKPSTTTTTTTTTENGLFDDDYDDSDYDEDNDHNEYDDWNDDEYDDDNDNSFLENEWQAEQATEAPKTARISPLTKYKWDHYGTRAKVEESRRQHLQLSNQEKATNAVILHYMNIKKQGQCLTPQLRVISVQSEHPNSATTYTPQCTVLHRCAEDTGCCSNFQTKCGPKTSVKVDLYFYAKSLDSSETKIEKLTFYNHTECACIEKSKRPNVITTENTIGNGLSLRFMSQQPDNIRHCKCPEEFSPKYRYHSGCNCDCEEYNQDCIHMKKGKEFFSLTDRMCILDSQCGIPICEYGAYMRHIGRCPLKQEKLELFSKISVH